jgi:antitoxin MazE
MPSAVKARIVKIGNSQGIRIPKLLLDQADLGEEVELELRGEHIVIRSAHRARRNWADKFKAMAAQGDDKLLDGDIIVTAAWDEEEWEW